MRAFVHDCPAQGSNYFLVITELNFLYTIFWWYAYIMKLYIHYVSKKTCDHIFDDKLTENCSFTKIFGTLIAMSIGHWQVF